jgi:hypothetical protein
VTAPIFFNDKRARAQLLERGYAFTLRRRRGTGWTRAREGSLYESLDLGQVLVLHVADRPTRVELGRFLWASGFQTVPDWEGAAGKRADTLYLVVWRPGWVHG